MKIAVIGCGHWGPNLVRNFASIESVDKVVAVDSNDEALSKIDKSSGKIELKKDALKAIEDSSINAIVVATPPETHFDLAKKALEQNKHVFVEKPLALNSKDSEELIALADEKKLTLMVGHLMLYHPAIKKLKELVDSGELGDICYAYSWRLNLGLYQRNMNVLWDLGPHDISMLLFLMQKNPLEANCSGRSFFGNRQEDVIFGNLSFEGDIFCNMHLSWLDPLKVRKMVLVGSKKMAVFDDMHEQKLRLFDKGVVSQKYFENIEEWKLGYKTGETIAPKIEDGEPLNIECNHFVECIETGKTPLSDGRNGLEVVKVLEAMQNSLEKKGENVSV